MTKKIDLFCIGSPKAGTTWLFQQLRDHPQLFIPNEKEIHYFNQYIPESPNLPNPNLLKGPSFLIEKYQEGQLETLWADFSTSYLYDVGCADRIYKYNKESKIICIIRNPIDRAYSHFLFLQQRAFIKNMPFEKAIIKRPDIMSKGLYYKQLLPYFNKFKKSKILVILFDDIVSNPHQVLNTIEQFLSIEHIEPAFLNKAVNQSKDVHMPWLTNLLVESANHNSGKNSLKNRLINKLISINSKPFSNVSTNALPALYSQFLPYFKEDLDKLSSLLDFDLTQWQIN